MLTISQGKKPSNKPHHQSLVNILRGAAAVRWSGWEEGVCIGVFCRKGVVHMAYLFLITAFIACTLLSLFQRHFSPYDILHCVWGYFNSSSQLFANNQQQLLSKWMLLPVETSTDQCWKEMLLTSTSIDQCMLVSCNGHHLWRKSVQ